MLAENHSHSQCEVSSFGEDNCDDAVLGVDTTKRFLKIRGPPPSLSSYTAKEHTPMVAVGVRPGVGKALGTWEVTSYEPHSSILAAKGSAMS